MIEVYDLDQAAASKLANISTRAFVGTGSNIVIAGFILGNGAGSDTIILRGIGPSLTAFGVPNALADPKLELRDSNGALITMNDNCQDDPAQAGIVAAAGLSPTNPLESCIAATLSPSQYTALLAGVNNGTGVGLVEVYDLGNGAPVPSPTPSASPSATSTPAACGGGPGGESCVECFDSVTAPALPPGWVATNPEPGDGTLWVTSTTSPDSGPNNAFIAGQDGKSDKVLDRLGGRHNVRCGTNVSFRNNFNTPLGWAGGVLEVSSPNISGGDFLDIADPLVGGSFVTGGLHWGKSSWGLSQEWRGLVILVGTSTR